MFSKRFNFLLILFKSLNACIISYHQHVLCLASVRKKFTKCLSNLCKYRSGIYCCFSVLASDGYRSLVGRDGLLVEISGPGGSFLAHATSGRKVSLNQH